MHHTDAQVSHPNAQAVIIRDSDGIGGGLTITDEFGEIIVADTFRDFYAAIKAAWKFTSHVVTYNAPAITETQAVPA
jgi:hypothetical protein